ncbi:HNH endonuclease signature motif containing protein [Enterobacter roggenkampii]|uniref:HNH endonuclease signature motif containing protein n=1 Tax=Enterobacter roggenkampii TaxID=1812935 RepID=UPI001C9B77D7|nr:HNH endonuclease signature motif containing protein [Enterobacter roggenkampii]MBY7247810.1 HNH endonuclease [Enterobacter roggenkampii]
MFRLCEIYDFERDATLLDFENIVSPKRGLELACYYYVLDYSAYKSRLYFDIPNRKWNGDRHFGEKFKRQPLTYYDPIYDDLERELLLGRIVAVDTDKHWTWYNNPFSFDDNGEIVYEPFMPGSWECSFRDSVLSAYHVVLERNQRIKPRPTQKIQYGAPGYVEPEQHAQSAKTINNKNVGRLLAAGGVYNGNVEGFRKTAEQLGGEALEGYKGVMTDTNIGMGIAAASILLVKNPAMAEELTGFLGKTKNTKVFLQNVKVEQINYLRRPRDEYLSLRKEFDNTVRKNFMKSLSVEPGIDHYFNTSQNELMAHGGVPDSWQVHHKLPLDDGGDNSFGNLILIQTKPYHNALTGAQKSVTKDLMPGQSIDTLWPMLNGTFFSK